MNGDFFMDYIAASGSTQKSLGLTLNRVVDNKPQYQDNFVTLANRAGFQTWWFSNQGQIGEYDTAIASIAKRADEAHFLKNGDFEADKNTRDDALLTMTAQVLATERTQPQLIVLHLMGSHPGPATALRKIRDVCPVERDVLLFIHHDANRRFAPSALYSASS